MSRALVRGITVFETLAEADDRGLGPSAIAEAVKIDKATATRILHTLMDMDYVQQDETTRRYRVTGKIVRLAQGVRSQFDLRSMARPYLRRLSEMLNETVHLGVMEDLRIVYLDKLESTNSIQLVSAVGQTMPLHSTSLGKAILSALPEAELEARLARMDFAARTERTITDIDEFRAEVKRTRERGYATDDQENEPGGACVASAIADADGWPVGAISVSGPEFRIRGHLETFGVATRDTAAAIARAFGGGTG